MMRRLFITAILALASLGFFPGAAGAQDGFVLIAHQDVPTDSLTKADASDYFLKKTTVWAGSKIDVKPVDSNAREVRDAFSMKVHDRSRSAIKQYWQRQIFTGRGTPPPEKESDADVIDYVRTNAGAIGYVAVGTSLPSSVKVVRIRQ